jgi:DNA-binding LacI/PurR family transcriptional regulator
VTRQLIERMPWITAIACYNDLTAIGAMRALRAAGRRAPEDVSIIGFDDIAAASWIVPGLTTISQQKAEMGRLAVDYLARALEARQDGIPPEVIRLQTVLRERESTGPAPLVGGPATGDE